MVTGSFNIQVGRLALFHQNETDLTFDADCENHSCASLLSKLKRASVTHPQVSQIIDLEHIVNDPQKGQRSKDTIMTYARIIS